MLRIALCDDNQAELNMLRQHVEQLATHNEISFCCYRNGNGLISDIQSGKHFDLIFLDIIMPGFLNGIEAASEIRKTDKLVQIVFLTASKEFAVDSYSLDALDYILKPVSSESLVRAIRKYKERRKTIKTNELIIQDKNGIVRIALNDLYYVEAQDHNLIYHLSDGSTIQCRQKFADIEQELLMHSNFVKTHRSYIVNLDYVSRIGHSDLTLFNNEVVFISRANSKSVTDSFLKHKFTKG